jgi:stage II sporulation protein D
MAAAGRSTPRILAHYYRGTTLGTSRNDPTLAVNVGYRRSAVLARLRALAAGGRMRVCAMVSGQCRTSARILDRVGGQDPVGEVRLTRSGASVRARVTDETGATRAISGRRIRIRWTGTRYRRGAASVLRLDNGREYRHGQLNVYATGSGSLNAVLSLRLQAEYLRGIAEMPSSWHRAALRAQAIIARTFALRVGAGQKPDCDCNLRDSVVHQVYAGWAKETEPGYGGRWVGAVTSTAGRVVIYDRALAETYYYSSSGGHTLNSEDVWAAAIPYLRSVADPWSLGSANPNRAWSARLTQARASALFGLRNITRITVTARHEGGAAKSITARNARGRTSTITGKADRIRSLFGLKSAWIRSVAAG